MIKLSANLSKKVPIGDVPYSSQQFGAAMEIEVSDSASPDEITKRLKMLYDMLSRSVDDQIASSNNPAAEEPQSQSAPDAFPSRSNNGHASLAQVKAIFAIAKERGVGRDGLTNTLRRDFGVDKPEDLTVRQASEVIDRLKKLEAAHENNR